MEKKENRGGARKGAGGPRVIRQYSDKYRAQVEESFKRRAAKLGLKSWTDALADLALNPNLQDVARIGAWKLVNDIFSVKRTESKIKGKIEHFDKPQVYLPERMKRPVKTNDEDAPVVH